MKNRSDFVGPSSFADDFTSRGSSPRSRPKHSPSKSGSRSPPKSRSPKRGFLPRIIKQAKQAQQRSASRSLERKEDYSPRSSAELSTDLLAQLAEDNDDSASQQDARKASRRAIDIMMKNIQNKQKPIWVPGGRGEQHRIFHENYLMAHGGLATMPLKSSNM